MGVVADALSRNLDLLERKISAFREIKDKWYIERVRDVQKTFRKFKNWQVVDGMLHKHTVDPLLDPLYNREEAWSLVVPLEYRDQVMWDTHN